jgi:hypothetical protein
MRINSAVRNYLCNFTRRSRKLLVTTKTEDEAIARPAHIGFSRPEAASGIAATLYAKAQNTLVRIVRNVHETDGLHLARTVNLH